jgi:hypothetical protein
MTEPDEKYQKALALYEDMKPNYQARIDAAAKEMIRRQKEKYDNYRMHKLRAGDFPGKRPSIMGMSIARSLAIVMLADPGLFTAYLESNE